MNTQSKLGRLEKAVGMLLMFVLVILLTACFDRISRRGNVTIGISNCRQVIYALHIYAADRNNRYPDSEVPLITSSNDAFRQLFITEVLDNEMIFSCPVSPFIPDGNIGSKPDFTEAVKAGENHWAMTKRLTNKSPGSIPFVFENPVKAEWPPKWNANVAGKAVKGRAWSGGKIIVGLNDSSVTLMELESQQGFEVPLKAHREGKDIFELAAEPPTFFKSSILDVQ